MKIPKSINILGFPFLIETKPKDFDLFIEKDGIKKKAIGTCNLGSKKITLKESDIMDIAFFHENCEGRHLLRHESLSELEIHEEAVFWLSIFLQLIKTKNRRINKHGRK